MPTVIMGDFSSLFPAGDEAISESIREQIHDLAYLPDRDRAGALLLICATVCRIRVCRWEEERWRQEVKDLRIRQLRQDPSLTDQDRETLEWDREDRMAAESA